MDIIVSGNERVIKTMHLLQGESEPGTVWIPSVFNYFQKTPNGYLLYNTLYNSLLRLTNVEYDKIRGKKKPGKELIKKFISNGIFVDNGINERKCYEHWAKVERSVDKPYLSLNITTTLKCNARCSYCYEKGVKHKDFAKQKLPVLMNFITERVSKEETLALNWFGGEPLLNGEVFDFVTEELSKAQRNFSSYIITNGSLITKRLVMEEFARWQVKDVQITFDGMSKTYEKRKAYMDQKTGIFQRVLNKVGLVAAAGIRVHLRLNIDRENMEEILKLLRLLEERFGNTSEVTWYPAFLTGIDDDLTEAEKINFIKRMFLTLKNPTKMNITRRIYSMPKSRACMRNDPRSLSIDISGNIYSCEHLVGQDCEAIGNLVDFDEVENKRRLNIGLQKECKTCVFLPKCMGGCAANLTTNDEPCMIEKYMIQGYLAYMAEN